MQWMLGVSHDLPNMHMRLHTNSMGPHWPHKALSLVKMIARWEITKSILIDLVFLWDILLNQVLTFPCHSVQISYPQNSVMVRVRGVAMS